MCKHTHTHTPINNNNNNNRRTNINKKKNYRRRNIFMQYNINMLVRLSINMNDQLVSFTTSLYLYIGLSSDMATGFIGLVHIYTLESNWIKKKLNFSLFFLLKKTEIKQQTVMLLLLSISPTTNQTLLPVAASSSIIKCVFLLFQRQLKIYYLKLKREKKQEKDTFFSRSFFSLRQLAIPALATTMCVCVCIVCFSFAH